MPTVAAPIPSKLCPSVIGRSSGSALESEVDPSPYFVWVEAGWPMVRGRIWVIASAIVGESWWNQVEVEPAFPKIGMVGQQNAQQTAPRIQPGLSEAGSDFPVDVFALPGARADQDNRYSCVSDELIANPLTDRFRGYVLIVDISVMHRFVHEVPSESVDEVILVRLIGMVVTDKRPVSGHAIDH